MNFDQEIHYWEEKNHEIDDNSEWETDDEVLLNLAKNIEEMYVRKWIFKTTLRIASKRYM